MEKLSYKAPPFVKDKETGIKYKVHSSALNILHTIIAFEQAEDDFERAMVLIYRIFGTDAPLDQRFADKALEIINNGEVDDEEYQDAISKQSMDIIQDYPVYRMDIIREYGIDIEKEQLEFSDLVSMISNLSGDSQLNNYSKIRTQNLSEIKNPRDKQKFKRVQDSIKIIDRNKPEEEVVKESIFDIARKVQKEKAKKK